ncbi:MAG TPA: hypothetical protein VGP07_05540 [Polyangia bacterium]|jgi:hypothetical protein
MRDSREAFRRRTARRRSLLAGAALLVVGSSQAGAITEHRHIGARTGMIEIPVEELMTAVRRKDRAEIGRLAERIGPARLGEALRRPDAPAVLAALTGIAALPGRARLIGPVTELLTVSDATIAAAAARTLGEILAPLTTADLDEWDVPSDLITAACGALRGAVLLPANPTLERLAALEAMGDSMAVCHPSPDLVGLLKDPAPSIRRAAALVLRPQQRLATGGFAAGTRDVDPAVASASVAALCQAIAEPAAWPKGGVREPIWEQTRQLARRLALAPATPPDDAVEMLDCLDPTLAGDRQILDGMRAHRRTPLGERAAAILERPPGRTAP